MVTLSPAYSITIKVGEKLFAGHVDNSLAIMPQYEPILRKSLGGRFDLDFVSVDLDMRISGLTYERTSGEAATHNDFADLRAACSNPVSVAFVYGAIVPGSVVLTGNAKLSEYQETTGSGKISGQWSCRLKSVRGSVQEEVVPPATQDVKYGLLYNWYAAVDPRGICAEGWHIGANAEYGTLMRYLDPTGLNNNNAAGGKLKEAGFVHWSSPNTDATNETKANFRGSAARIAGGSFRNLHTQCRIWHTDATNSASAFHSVLNYNNGIFLTWYSGSGSGGGKYFGESLRPFKDSTDLSPGESGIYIGNNGRAYRTICIGTHEILADNLAETQFRTGEAIPEVTDNAAWAALTTAGMCAYNNDWSNV